jgi:putative isomerase
MISIMKGIGIGAMALSLGPSPLRVADRGSPLYVGTPGGQAIAAPEYQALRRATIKGWNTWNVMDVLSHVLLPEGFAVTLEIEKDKEKVAGPYIGKQAKETLVVTAYGHAYDGSYTDLSVLWKAMSIRVQSATAGDDLVLLVSNDRPQPGVVLKVVPRMLWDRKGLVRRDGDGFMAEIGDKVLRLFAAGEIAADMTADSRLHRSLSLTGTIGISTGRNRGVDEIRKIVETSRAAHELKKLAYGELGGLYEAQQSVLAWNTIYDHVNDRLITPVARDWCYGNGGYVLFEWDTYFACAMLALDNRDLAYANLIAVTKGITPEGFVPNVASGKYSSRDRSQPPVGALVVKEVYRRYRDRWLLDVLFDDLLTWNRWWPKNRDDRGYLCWGTTPYKVEQQVSKLEERAMGKLLGAKFESGLDNSPMYDNAPFDPASHLMRLADVGLMSLYIADCKALADLAGALKKADVEKELLERADRYAASLRTLWDETTGLYLNKNLETGQPDHHLAPTLFYPLLAGVPSQRQAERMIREHLTNEKEFWGEWVLPSIARNDPQFTNDYWKGEVWGPMNFLVYLGLRNYDLPQARKDLVLKSRRLLLKSWEAFRGVHENYNSTTGAGTFDDYYHWGALLGFMSFLENGTAGAWGKPL